MMDVLYERKNFYVSWVMLYVSWVILCQQIEWIRKAYVCVFMKLGKGKRIMRSNRRETWGSLNLPPWLSTSYTISIYFFSLCRLQTAFTYYGKNWEIKPICGEVMSNFLQECAENCSLVGLNAPLKTKLNDDAMMSYYFYYSKACMHVVFPW